MDIQILVVCWLMMIYGHISEQDIIKKCAVCLAVLDLVLSIFSFIKP
jgi:hypothetical protein